MIKQVHFGNLATLVCLVFWVYVLCYSYSRNDDILRNINFQVKELTKHLVVMGQLCQDQKDKIQKLTLAQGQSPENALHVNACQRELAGK